MALLILFLSIAFFLITGVPIGVALAVAMIVLIIYEPVTSFEFIAQSLYSELDNFIFIAIPFFMIAGSIMEKGGLSKRLVNAANSIIGNVHGSLGMVAILTSALFGAVSGSAIATVAAIGSIMIPEMTKEGYDLKYSAGLIAVSGSLGMIVPPSIPLVVFGVINNISINALFMSGIGPAIVLTTLLMTVNYFYSKKRGYGDNTNDKKINLRNIVKNVWDAKWALFMPIIILGGIYSGVFTATEASVVACTYGIIVGFFIYKELTFKSLWEVYKSTTSFSGAMMFTFAPAGALGAMFSYLNVPNTIKEGMFNITSNQIGILLMIFVILVIAGMFMETSPIIIILSPLLMTIALEIGVNPVHFGIFMVTSVVLGIVTPPVALNLFVAQTLTGINMMKIARVATPFIIVFFITALLVMFFPDISLLLLRILNIPH